MRSPPMNVGRRMVGNHSAQISDWVGDHESIKHPCEFWSKHSVKGVRLFCPLCLPGFLVIFPSTNISSNLPTDAQNTKSVNRKETHPIKLHHGRYQRHHLSRL